MHFRRLGLAILLLTSMTYSYARKPAVEDFVGIEVEHPDSQGTETLYNLEKDIQQIGTLKSSGPKVVKVERPAFSYSSERQPWSPAEFFGLALILSLPLISWLLVMNHMRRKASVETASNIEVLENYRKSRQKAQEDPQDIKRAS